MNCTFLGTFPQLVITILKAIPSTKDAAVQVDWAFIAILPNYNMGNGISNLYQNYQNQDLCYNQYPSAIGIPGGKDSLKKICDNLAATGKSFPCCQGEVHFLVYLMQAFPWFEIPYQRLALLCFLKRGFFILYPLMCKCNK